MFPNEDWWYEGEKIVIADGRVEIRCPGPAPFKKLFLVLKQEHAPQEGMYMEIACADCAKWARENGAPAAKRFLHYYDSTGKCVSNKVTAY
jgi:hypothetical protein